jgi:hypothetical protein
MPRTRFSLRTGIVTPVVADSAPRAITDVHVFRQARFRPTLGQAIPWVTSFLRVPGVLPRSFPDGSFSVFQLSCFALPEGWRNLTNAKGGRPELVNPMTSPGRICWRITVFARIFRP